MTEIKIRNIDALTLSQLNKIAKEKGYDSREEFLRDLFEKVALEDFQIKSDVRYQYLVNEYNDLVTRTTQMIVNAVTALLSERK